MRCINGSKPLFYFLNSLGYRESTLMKSNIVQYAGQVSCLYIFMMSHGARASWFVKNAETLVSMLVLHRLMQAIPSH